jgi:hypothetical protein
MKLGPSSSSVLQTVQPQTVEPQVEPQPCEPQAVEPQPCEPQAVEPAQTMPWEPQSLLDFVGLVSAEPEEQPDTLSREPY